MPEIVGTFLWTELRDERADCSIEGRNSSRCNLAQECLEFAIRQLDWVEVGRVFRQVPKGRARFLDRRPNAEPQMDAAVIHHDDVVALERGNQTLRDIGSMPCSRIQRRRACATSARCRSAACRLFFKGDVVSV